MTVPAIKLQGVSRQFKFFNLSVLICITVLFAGLAMRRLVSVG